MIEVSVRPAVLDDLVQVLEIENEAYPSPWTRKHFVEELEKESKTFWVLTDDETDEKVFTYAVFWILGEECEIHNIATHSQFKQQGFGKKIFQKIVAESLRNEAKRVVLYVRKSNASAIQFYQALGMTIHSIRESFYSDGESAYLFELDLSGQRINF